MIVNLHMQCAGSNSGYLEYMYDPGFWNPDGFQAGFARTYPIDKEGYIHAPTAAGLGIEWDNKFFQRHGLQME
jgi:L-alanine-DL-glutamate epimerase-like enolase superfamily enzyme